MYFQISMLSDYVCVVKIMKPKSSSKKRIQWGTFFFFTYTYQLLIGIELTFCPTTTTIEQANYEHIDTLSARWES